jgi:hypothetical protein
MFDPIPLLQAEQLSLPLPRGQPTASERQPLRRQRGRERIPGHDQQIQDGKW